MTATISLEFVAPIRIQSEMNNREHWRSRKKRFATQRFFIRLQLAGCQKDPRWGFIDGPPYIVTLTRIAPRRFDDDNLASGFKACRDEIAAILKIDDGDSRITFLYDQQKGKPREYAIRIRIEAALKQEAS